MTELTPERHAELIRIQKSSHQMSKEDRDYSDWQDGFDSLLESAQAVARENEALKAELLTAQTEVECLTSSCEAISGHYDRLGEEHEALKAGPNVGDLKRLSATVRHLSDEKDELTAQVETLVERIASALDDIENDDINSAYTILKVALATTAPAALEAHDIKVWNDAIQEVSRHLPPGFSGAVMGLARALQEEEPKP